jgi:hypothetical protein
MPQVVNTGTNTMSMEALSGTQTNPLANLGKVVADGTVGQRQAFIRDKKRFRRMS